MKFYEDLQKRYNEEFKQKGDTDVEVERNYRESW